MTRKNVIGFFVVSIWIILGVLLTIYTDNKKRLEQESWSEEQWREYYEANENRSFRGE